MNYQEAIDFLFPLRRFGMKPGLERVLQLLHAVGDPQKRLGKVFHIAGTNGKGTVACALAAIFDAAGHKTGLYTSPHLVSFMERIRVDGKMIPESRVAAYCKALEDEIIDGKATFFEATTAIAFMYFSDMMVDVSVVETGMGGRLDATNVVDSDYVIIPNIGRDHTNWLGDTIGEIAVEKAAIIKKGSRVYTAVKDPAALKPLLDRADAVGAEVTVLQDVAECVVHTTAIGKLGFSLKAPGFDMLNLDAPVTGDFHALNLSLAVMAACDAGIEQSAIRQGLLSIKKSGYGARLERLRRHPDLLLDVSHNPEGIEKSVEVLRSIQDTYCKVYAVLGLVRDKDAREMVRRLKKLTNTVITVNLSSEKGMSSAELGDLCRDEGFRVTVAATAREALDVVHGIAGKDDLILITGSFYLAGEVMQLLNC